MIDPHHGWNVSFKPLFLGYIVSLLLTVALYHIVTRFLLTEKLLVFTIFALAIAQAVIQLIFFLHLGLESGPHWYLVTFLFMALVIIIIIGGSLWIMYQLNYNVMPEMMH